MTRRKRKSNNPAGRPVSVGGSSTAVVVTVKVSADLRDAAVAAAAREAMTVSAWWRRAGSESLARTR